MILDIIIDASALTVYILDEPDPNGIIEITTGNTLI